MRRENPPLDYIPGSQLCLDKAVHILTYTAKPLSLISTVHNKKSEHAMSVRGIVLRVLLTIFNILRRYLVRIRY